MATLLGERLANPGQLRIGQTVSITVDDTITDPVCDCCVGFLAFKRDAKREIGAPAGTGTFAKIGRQYGILTAAHVLEPLDLEATVGLVRFSKLQREYNRRLDLSKTDREILWSKKEGQAPDIAFLMIADVDGWALEAEGAVFYNLDRPHEFRAGTGENRLARCHLLAGEVGEWVEDIAGKDGDSAKIEVGGLCGAVKNLRVLKEGETELVEVEIDHDAGLRSLKSYGGMSGGGLWELQVEVDRALKPVEIQKRLIGVAFRQSEDRQRITSNGAASIDQIKQRVEIKLSALRGAKR